MITRNTVKSIVRLLTAVGTGAVVNGVITNNVTRPENLPAKVVIKTTSLVVGGAIAEKTAPYADRQVDFMFDTYAEIKEAFTQK
jgi:hypothetical protein